MYHVCIVYVLLVRCISLRSVVIWAWSPTCSLSTQNLPYVGWHDQTVASVRHWGICP